MFIGRGKIVGNSGTQNGTEEKGNGMCHYYFGTLLVHNLVAVSAAIRCREDSRNRSDCWKTKNDGRSEQ